MAIIANVKCKWPHGECYSTFSVKTLSLATSLNLVFVILKFFCSRTFESYRFHVSKSSFFPKNSEFREDELRSKISERIFSNNAFRSTSKSRQYFCPFTAPWSRQIKGSSCDSSLPMSHQFLNFFIFSFIFNQTTP